MEERCESQIHSRYDEAAKDWKKLKFPESCGKPGASYEVRAAADTHVGLMGDRRAWLGVAESDLFCDPVFVRGARQEGREGRTFTQAEEAMKRLIVAILLASTTGCGFAHRHPTAMKVAVVGGGIAIGGIVGYQNRASFCSYTYEGAPYYGTTCPKPGKK